MAEGEWHHLPVRVYYEDTDAQGVVYFANYLRFMERGRTEWLRARGVGQEQLLAERGLCFSLINTANKFHAPARFDDQLLVMTRLTDSRGARFSFEQRIRQQDDDGQLVCSGECEVACVEAKSFRPRRLPRGLLTG
jgi:acyl-CoA thioester hydrolase